jgi:pimeloyl-ACP methyl ester carboxylesterase
MAEVRASEIQVQGRPCRYWAGGPREAPPLLLLHGGLGDAALHWHHNFADLSEDFRLLAPDLPGFGRTAPLPQPGYEGYAAWIQAFGAAGGATSDLIVVGNSMGAAVARVFAAMYPQRVAWLALVDGGRPVTAPAPVRALAALPPARALLTALIRLYATSDRVLRQCVADPARLTPTLRAQMRRGIRAYVAIQGRMLPQPPPPLATLRVRCPTLVIWGAQDGLAGPGVGRTLAEEVGAAAVAVIDGAGHMPMFEQPAEFGRVLRRFVDSAAQRGP